MFRRRGRYETVPTDPHAPHRAGTVRLLETEEELRAAVERARAFERMSVGLEAIRALKYERYLYEPGGDLADVVPIDAERSAHPEQRRREPW
jgi:hypothetical protein